MRTVLILLVLISTQALAAGSVSGPSAGRYQVIQLSEFRKDQILIDSATGELWRYICNAEGSGCYWSQEVIEGKFPKNWHPSPGTQ